MDYSYNDYFGIEELDKEYKEFTFNLAGLVLDSDLAEKYCLSNVFDFNDTVIKNLKKYIKIYVTLNACASFNSNIDSNFYIGINDDGFIKGIPFCGELPIEYIKSYIYKILSENISNPTLGYIDFNKYVKINIVKINKPKIPTDKLNPEFSKYIKKKNKHMELLDYYHKEMTEWKRSFDFANQKLFKLINNSDSRAILIEYIKSIDPTNNVIDLLYSDYQEEYKQHTEVIILKEIKTSPYYWITRWKDMTISKLRKEKPKMLKSLPSMPTNLIMNVGEMIPWWIHNNTSMNLYMIQIEFKTSEFGIRFNSSNLFSYLDYNKKKWIKCHRTINNGGPACFPL